MNGSFLSREQCPLSNKLTTETPTYSRGPVAFGNHVNRPIDSFQFCAFSVAFKDEFQSVLRNLGCNVYVSPHEGNSKENKPRVGDRIDPVPRSHMNVSFLSREQCPLSKKLTTETPTYSNQVYFFIADPKF